MNATPPRFVSTPRLLPALAFVLVAACGSSGNGDGAVPATEGDRGPIAATTDPDPQAPPVRTGEALVIFGTDTVVAEVARTAAEREKGLMDREEVPDGTGMLFVFENERTLSFWMKNTYVPLDVAYIDADLRIVTIHQMEPLVETTYDSTEPAMFALEVRRGWFEEQGIEVGDTAEIVYGG